MPLATEKLYWRDPFATEFGASSARVARLGARTSIVLERSLFYPESGGQYADIGTIVVGEQAFAIDDVQIDDDGVVHHLVSESCLPIEHLEGPIRGSIDLARRRDHMTWHTAQHALSRALVESARAETVSSRLGANACTIDVDIPSLEERHVAAAEDLVNSVVMSDVVVRELFPSPEELASLPLRRAPKVTENVRVIDIDAFDMSPCGGTHCTRTGQIGLVRVVGVERYKGGFRVLFHAGRRALEDVRNKERVLGELARDFTCGMLDVGAGVAKLRADLKARTDALSTTRGELVELLAERLLGTHPADPTGTTRITVVREGDDLGMLRTLAGRLAARPDVVAFCAAPDEASGEVAIVVQRGTSATFDCGRWVKATAARHGGRGGGRPERAEGRLSRGIHLADVAREDV
jgi:alanyl-tRNA synthetase